MTNALRLAPRLHKKGHVKGKYFQSISSTAPKITTTTKFDLTLTWSSKKSYIIMLLPLKSIHFMSLHSTQENYPQKN
jgi:hypothetical protein